MTDIIVRITSRPSKLQMLQDKYGYVVLGTKNDRKIGDVISGIDIYDDDISVVVVGFSTANEWRKQSMEAYGDDTGADEYFKFVKVRAE